MRRLVQCRREVSCHVRAGEHAVELLRAVQRFAPDFALHCAVLEELLASELIRVIIHPRNKVAEFRRIGDAAVLLVCVLFHQVCQVFIAQEGVSRDLVFTA